MNKMIHKLSRVAGKINRRHLQILLLLVTLTMLVLGAGAPAADGGSGGW